MFLGAGLAGLDDGRGVPEGMQVTEDHLFNLLGMCADPLTGSPLGRQPNRSHLPLAKRIAQRVEAIPTTGTETERAELMTRIEAEERAKSVTQRAPVAGFDLTFSPSKSVSMVWALADAETKAAIYACHHRAIDVVLAYAGARCSARARAPTASSKRTSVAWWPRRSPIGTLEPAPPSSTTTWWWRIVPGRPRMGAGEPWTAEGCSRRP